jgi:hypothetical protein
MPVKATTEYTTAVQGMVVLIFGASLDRLGAPNAVEPPNTNTHVSTRTANILVYRLSLFMLSIIAAHHDNSTPV